MANKAKEGFADITLQEINNYIKDIQNGTEDFSRFNLSEHAGLCTAGAPLIGASIVASYATASLTASSNAESGQGGSPANWEIDELVAAKGFKDNWNGQGVNYISDRLSLEDMHPANVFIDVVTGKPICIDCIVKFVKSMT
jgi:hypothetical protein